ncbi:MAG: hypothetical protein UGE23_07115 [Peptococcaceae bacterium]|nr:hypothetical protein [Peptococcaceae bacterium]
MGSANKTKALQLPQWLGNEYFERLDMNGAFSNIEKAVATFDYLARTYGVTETYPDADTGTITATVGSGSPVTATRSTVVSEADGVTTYVETTTIDGEETVRTWTEGETTASMEVTSSE